MKMMNEDEAIIAKILREDAGLNGEPFEDMETGWTTVSYAKRRHRKKQDNNQEGNENRNSAPEDNSGDVFRQIDQDSDERRRRIVEAQKAALEAVAGGASNGSSSSENSGENDAVVADVNVDGGRTAVKKPKAKSKKRKVSVAEAAAKIDADNLTAFLADIMDSYESQQDIQLMRFADYFGRAFASVGSGQFPWMKLLKESNVAKMVDVPLSHVPEAVYKTSMEWLNRQSLDDVGSFVLRLWDSILSDLASHQEGTVKGSKKMAHVQPPPSNSQVAIFVVLAMALRRKPDILISLLATLEEGQKYVGQDKLPLTVWVIAQACQGDVAVGFYMWIRVLFPMLSGKSVNPQSRDLILQLLERILSMPKAQQILLNGAVRKGERLVPPAALVTLMRITFPPASARIKATDRFEAVYPTLKKVALAGSPGSKALKQVSQKTFCLAVEAASEGVPELSAEAADVAIWCLTENSECYNQWEKLYLDNVEGSVVVLKKLSEGWRPQFDTNSIMESVKATLNCMKQKTEKALAAEDFADQRLSLKEANKNLKSLLALFPEGWIWGWRPAAAATLFVVTATLLYNIIQTEFDQLMGECISQS